MWCYRILLWPWFDSSKSERKLRNFLDVIAFSQFAFFHIFNFVRNLGKKFKEVSEKQTPLEMSELATFERRRSSPSSPIWINKALLCLDFMLVQKGKMESFGNSDFGPKITAKSATSREPCKTLTNFQSFLQLKKRPIVKIPSSLDELDSDFINIENNFNKC